MSNLKNQNNEGNYFNQNNNNTFENLNCLFWSYASIILKYFFNKSNEELIEIRENMFLEKNFLKEKIKNVDSNFILFLECLLFYEDDLFSDIYSL